MITAETAGKIWNCHNEIRKSHKLIADMKEQLAKTNDPNLLDAFGRKQDLQLGIPSGDSSHRLYNVRLDLALKVIEAHIEDKEKELVELGAIAKIELT